MHKILDSFTIRTGTLEPPCTAYEVLLSNARQLLRWHFVSLNSDMSYSLNLGGLKGKSRIFKWIANARCFS